MAGVSNPKIQWTIPILLVVLAALCTPVLGKTIYVDDDGQADFDNIQAGIDNAEIGDTVLVMPGEYIITVPITFRGKAITVQSEAGRDETTIRMSTPADTNHGSVIFENNETAASGLSAVVKKRSVAFESLCRYIEAELFDPGFREGDSNYHALTAVSDGKIHFAVNTHDPDRASRYYTFDPATNVMTFIAKMDTALGEDAKTLVSQGKIHTPLIEHDGKVWFATMTAFYEGRLPGTGNDGKIPYGGGHFMSYDLKTGEFTDLAKVIPSESIMTMNMDTKNEILYGLTWPSGLLVSYDIRSDELCS